MTKRTISRTVLMLAIAAVAKPALATDYYFNSSVTGGLGTQSSPFGSLAPINSLDLDPGDHVWLTGTFNAPAGGISLTSEDAGTASNPVTIGGLNNAKATINAGNSFGLKGNNVGGIDVSGLRLVGSGASSVDSTGLYTNTQNGIRFYADKGVKQNRIHINNVDVKGFGENGISLQSTNGASGFNDVRITNSVTEFNQRAGVSMEGDYNESGKSAHTNVYIGKVRANNNAGRANRPDEGNSGSGIVIGQVNGAVIERSVAYANGTACASTQGGAVGIWTWDSNKVMIQYNESYSNGTAGHHDGGGFDLDGGVTNSVMQYNYSHDNDGAGYLLAEFKGAKEFSGNTVRYNISQDDGRKNGYGGIHAFGTINDTDVYNNTIFMSPADKAELRPDGVAPAAIKFRDGSKKEIRFFNNLLILTDEGGNSLTIDPKLIYLSGASGFTFLNNNYWNTDGSPLSNPNDPQGLNIDPELLGAGDGPTLNNADQLAGLLAYMMSDSSALVDQGLDLSALGINAGPQDFYGLDMQGKGFDIGASEGVVEATPTPEPGAFVIALGLGALSMRRKRASQTTSV